MTHLLDDLDAVLAPRSTDVRDVYERVAGRYDHFRALWLRWAGVEAEQAMLADLAKSLRPGQRVLDAGCGTGALAREILKREPAVELTLLDLSPAMLELAADVPGERLVGSVLDLPFRDDNFDVVVSGWVIETVAEPKDAVSELLRVLAPDGHLFYTFCSLPEGWVSRTGTALLRRAVKRGFAGEFLPEERTPWHDCERSHRVHFRGGLTTEVALAKCCIVTDPPTPS